MSTINDLRDHLFATLTALRDKENPMDIARAKAVAEVAQTVINTAKVEVEAMKVSGATRSTGFLPAPEKTIPSPSAASPIDRQRHLRDTRRDRA